MPAVEACIRKGAGGIIAFASGYGETGLAERVAEEAALRDRCREAGLPLVGVELPRHRRPCAEGRRHLHAGIHKAGRAGRRRRHHQPVRRAGLCTDAGGRARLLGLPHDDGRQCHRPRCLRPGGLPALHAGMPQRGAGGRGPARRPAAAAAGRGGAQGGQADRRAEARPWRCGGGGGGLAYRLARRQRAGLVGRLQARRHGRGRGFRRAAGNRGAVRQGGQADGAWCRHRHRLGRRRDHGGRPCRGAGAGDAAALGRGAGRCWRRRSRISARRAIPAT